MAKDMELLQKMELTDESRAKLTALLEEAKKTKKVASKALVEALDAADATEEQTEQFYDVLEAAGVEIDVSDVLDLIGSSDALDSPTIDDMEAIESGELEAAPTDEELERAREQSKANVIMGLESTQSRMSHAGRSLLFSGEILTPEQIIDAYDRVTREDVVALAQEIFAWDRASLSAVGQVRTAEEYRQLVLG
jgi:predicted Zn-dependent peptidase